MADVASSLNIVIYLFICLFLMQVEVSLYFLCTLGITLGEDLTPEKKLHKRLFNDSYYSVDLLPLTNLSSTINVSFGFDLVKIVNVVSEYKIDSFLKINYTTDQRT